MPIVLRPFSAFWAVLAVLATDAAGSSWQDKGPKQATGIQAHIGRHSVLAAKSSAQGVFDLQGIYVSFQALEANFGEDAPTDQGRIIRLEPGNVWRMVEAFRATGKLNRGHCKKMPGSQNCRD